MPTPHVNPVAAASVATSSWANSVSTAVNQIGDALYPAGTLAFPWASLTGVPATFTPAAHAHLTGSVEGQVNYGSLTGVPASFTPAAHGASHRTGWGDPILIDWLQVNGKPASYPPTAHASSHGVGGSDQVIVPWAMISGAPNPWQRASAGPGSFGSYVWVGTNDPGGSAGEGDIWVKG